MRKSIIILLIMVVLVSSGFGVPDIYSMEQGFAGFASGVAALLPYASTIGLNWSDAFLGGFPHFGVGLTLGTVFMPVPELQKASDVFGIGLPSIITQNPLGGVPFPIYTVEGRIGGLLLPFDWDLGLKLGIMPESLAQQLAANDVYSDFTLVGIDFRVPLVKENLLFPAVSVGIGYNYLAGGLGLLNLFGADQDITVPTDVKNKMASPINTLTVQTPDMMFSWQSHTIDLKVQVSKSFLLFTPYLGLGAAYGFSQAGGGLSSQVLADGAAITQEQINQITDAFTALGKPAPNLSSTGIYINNDVSGLATRVYAGTSINILLLKLDLTVMYNFLSAGLGVSVNGRIQL